MNFSSSSSSQIWIGVYASLDGWVSKIAILAANKKDALAGLVKVIRDEGIEDRVEPAMTDVWLLEDILQEGVVATRSDITLEPADLRRAATNSSSSSSRSLVVVVADDSNEKEEEDEVDQEEYMDALENPYPPVLTPSSPSSSSSSQFGRSNKTMTASKAKASEK